MLFESTTDLCASVHYYVGCVVKFAAPERISSSLLYWIAHVFPRFFESLSDANDGSPEFETNASLVLEVYKNSVKKIEAMIGAPSTTLSRGLDKCLTFWASSRVTDSASHVSGEML